QLTLSQNITSAGAIVTLYPNVDGVSQSGGVLTGGGLLLRGVGTFALTRNNNFDMIAADVTGQLTYTDSDGLMVGTIGATSGINSGSNDVTLNSGGNMDLSQSITAASATVTLRPSAGGVTQSGGAITSSNLLLEGSGTFTINQLANDIGTLAAWINGSVSYRNSTALTIGSVGAIQGILTGDSDANGVPDIAGGDVDILAGGAITINEDINTRTGTGGQHNSIGEIFQSGSMIILGQGNITLAASGGDQPLIISSDLEITEGALFHIGDIIINARVYSTDNRPITLTSRDGSIDSTGGIIDSGGTDLIITAGSKLVLGTVNAGGGMLSLNSGDGVSANSGGVITAKELLLTGTGDFQLNNWNNDFDTMAAAVNGEINLTDRSGLDIGVVGAVSGISTSGGAVTILARQGPIAVRQSIDTGPGSGV
ncbi:unnamed protein product, partial [marine sediment metagenome]